MVKRPGGKLAARPLHFIWLLDTSGSMSVDGKITALNQAIRDTLPHMRKVAEDNPNAQVYLRCVTFSHGAEWHVTDPAPLDIFSWTDVAADPLQSSVAVDIIFLLDTSGSMGGEIDAVKSSCDQFADQIIREGIEVRLGLIGFDIGGHRGRANNDYKVRKLSTYTIGVWPLDTPEQFKRNIRSLSIGLFGGSGCYLANADTIDIFPHVVRAYGEPTGNPRVLVIISDEIGSNAAVLNIVTQLKDASVTAYVLGVPGLSGAHESIAKQTGGQFWSIFAGSRYDFSSVLVGKVATTIAKEVTQRLSSGSTSYGTDLGTALQLVARQMEVPPMDERGLPPVLALISDGQPTDDFDNGLHDLLRQPWGKRAVRIAIAIGGDADLGVLQKFIGNAELHPLRANNPEALVRYIRWASTAALKTASSPASQDKTPAAPVSPLIPRSPVPTVDPSAEDDVW